MDGPHPAANKALFQPEEILCFLNDLLEFLRTEQEIAAGLSSSTNRHTATMAGSPRSPVRLGSMETWEISRAQKFRFLFLGFADDGACCGRRWDEECDDHGRCSRKSGFPSFWLLPKVMPVVRIWSMRDNQRRASL